MALAYKQVKENDTSVRKAAQMYGVPESTLRDRTLGLQPVPETDTFLIKSGPSPVLTLGEEVELVEHVSYMASIGYGYSRAEFINIATDFAVSLV